VIVRASDDLLAMTGQLEYGYHSKLVGAGRTTRAARLVAGLNVLVVQSVKHLQKGGFFTVGVAGVNIGVLNGKGSVAGIAGAAVGVECPGSASLGARGTGAILARELAFRLGAESGDFALPCAAGLGALRNAVGVGGSACGAAHRGTAHVLARVRATVHAALVLGASDLAHRRLTRDLAFGTLSRFAIHLAVGAFAHRVADGRALWVIAKPFANRMALSVWVWFLDQRGGRNCHSNGEDEDEQLHLYFR